MSAEERARQEAIQDVARRVLSALDELDPAAAPHQPQATTPRKDPTPAKTRLCSTKTAYPSEERALEVMERWNEGLARKGKTGGPTRAYHCPHCGQWHLTSQPRRERRPRIDGLRVKEDWGHPRDGEPIDEGSYVRMHPFQANELRTSNPHELLDLMVASIDAFASRRARRAMERIESLYRTGPEGATL